MKRKTGDTARCPECGRMVSVIMNRFRDLVLERHTLVDRRDYQYTNGHALFDRAAAPGERLTCPGSYSAVEEK